MNKPYVSIILCIILIIFELSVNIIYKSRDVIKKKFCYLENKNINFSNFYKIYTSLLTHSSFLFHFLPNLILTAIFGTLLENQIGNDKMMKFIIICIFIFWTFMFILGIKSKMGCGSSAIFYSFFSYYFTIKASYEKTELNRIIQLLNPIFILIIIHSLGNIVSTSTEFTHVLSLMYGYIAGIYYSQSKINNNYFNLYK